MSTIRSRIRSLSILLLALAAPLLQGQTSADTMLTLFNGTSLLGWTHDGSWEPASGVLTTTGDGNRSILTAVPFADVSLQFDYNVDSNINTAVRLCASRENKGGFRITLDNSYSPWGVGGIEQLSHSATATVSAGWHHAQITFSNGQLAVKIDGTDVSSAGDLGARGGYLGFEVTGSGKLQIRSIHATPLNLRPDFNGTDLGGWKSIARAPASTSGMAHSLEKTLTFGLGGSSKPHFANWTVRTGAIHGEGGPGGLESFISYDDLILQLKATVKSESGEAPKKDDFTGIYLRNPAGQLAGGYPIGIGSYSGSINRLAAHAPAAETQVEETVILGGRTVAIWLGSNLATVYTDPRPESGTVAQGAKTSSGTLALILPNNKISIDVQRIAVASMPKSYGAAAKVAPPPPTPAPSPAAPVPSPELATQTALLQQQQASNKQAAAADANKKRSATLMNQALSASTPQEQMSLYSQVVELDPSNSAAVQGFRDAQTKVQAQQVSVQQQSLAQADQVKTVASREQQTLESLSKAQAAFLGGHMTEASNSLALAERLAPNNPLVRDLRSRISAASSLRTRLFFLAGGGGLLGMACLISLWIRRRRQQKYPVLALIRGLDSGRRYPLDKDTVRIGAIAQDGGQKNDIVVRDIEHAVSRFHCEIQRANGQLYITDLNSSNGTRINGERLDPGKPALLRKGAKLDLGGSVELEFDYDRRSKTKA